MNKKFLFAAMSLAALTACSTDDFESQQQVAEGVSPIQFEVINNDAMTRASMNGNKITWSAADGDLFTLYHGGTASGSPITTLSGYENATYKATAVEGQPAKLTTPSMIKSGSAIMVWPVDTTFSATVPLSIKIDKDQTKDIENHIPYVSDLIDITGYAGNGTYNEAGYNRTYPVYMRPMASQLNLVADYAGTDAPLKALATGTDPIEKIKPTSVEIRTNASGSNKFTTQIPLNFTAKTTGTGSDEERWNAEVPNNNFSHVTRFGTPSTSSDYLSTKCITGIGSVKFLMLPQPAITESTTPSTNGVDQGAIVVNTTYGKVIIGGAGTGSAYTTAEEADAWYRYLKATDTEKSYEDKATTETSGKGYKTTSSIKDGMAQVINTFSTHTHSAGAVEGEPTGAAATRYVKVLLTHLDMEGLHIKNDAQLYDVIRVWKELRLASANVYLDGDDNGEFEISQKTIKKINEVNAAAAAEATPRAFTAKPCKVAGEACETIVITGGNNIENMAFLLENETATTPAVPTAEVVLKAGENWKWAASSTAAKKLTIAPVGGAAGTNTGISKIINKGTFVSDATATLAVYDNSTPTANQINIPFQNDGTWNVNAGDVTVQFDVTNNGIVNIKKGAEYHQDITAGTTATTFENDAQTLEKRFVLNDPSISQTAKDAFVEKIGVVNNSGVFAVTGNTTVKGVINNYSLIEHADKDAKTYITANEFAGSNYATTTGFNAANNKIGRINLPYSNKDEDNISISAALNSGFVSVTVTSADAPTDGNLNASVVGDKVNYVIINSGVKAITEMTAAIKYIEFNDDNDTEIAWQTGTSGAETYATYEGLIVLSPVNIKLYTNITVNKGTYLGAKMYVGGTFTNTGGYDAYYGATADNATSMYITY